MPYSDRFAEKQAKLMRLKINRQHVLDRCEKLLAPKLRKDILLTETKLSRDKLDLMKLAIEQRRSIIEKKKTELTDLTSYNNELRLKLPRYQKRVSSLGKHAQNQRIELQNKICSYNDQSQALAALRRSRIRQFTKYIFPVYMSYDSSDSIEDLEFLGDDCEEEPPRRPQLHIVAPWIDADGDCSHIQAWAAQSKEGAGGPEAGPSPAQCAGAALLLAAQLVALLAWTLDVRTPHAISLSYEEIRSEYSSGRVWGGAVRRLRACAAALCARAGVRRLGPPPADASPSPWPSAPAPPPPPPSPLAAHGALGGLHALALAAAADDPRLGRVEPWLSRSASCSSEWAEAWQGAAPDLDEPEPPEHLCWPDANDFQEEEMSRSPGGAPAPSLVTSAAASIASMWRGWTK
ncbi:unnamed protein product, partial [Iphiclides podalirius]